MSSMYKLTEVKPNIFFLNFKDRYDMAMHFLRYQEFYESSSPNFKGKAFTIIDFMEWYSKEYGDGSFTYPRDWAGFNIPNTVISGVIKSEIIDRNKYDDEMIKIANKCKKKSSDGNYYLIGSVGKGDTLRHEIAHGFWYTTPVYKKDMTSLIKNLKPNFRKRLCEYLKKVGYDSSVYYDEFQAYLSTGMPAHIKMNGEDIPFIKLYNKYYNL